MGKVITRSVKRMLNALGMEVSRIPPWQVYDWLKTHDIRTVLDIGANIGQFALQIRCALPDAMLYSFEPLVDCYNQLTERMRDQPSFQAFNVALGDRNGTATIYRNDFSPSSSLLPMEELHRRAFPFTQKTRPENIEIRRLDDVAETLEINDSLLVKVDVQGMEDKVLLGGEKVLARTAVLIVETSFRPLYQGQPLFDRVYRLLCDQGFTFMGNEHNIRDPRDGKVLQSDSIFVRQGC